MVLDKEEYKAKDINEYGDFSQVIMSVAEITFNLLKDVYGSDKIELPISIEDVARGLGLSIYARNLNFANPRKYNQRIGELDGTNIYIEDTADWDVKRFAIAHEIGHFIIDKGRGPAQYSLPLLASNSNELVSDVYALFLLVPFELFLSEFESYINNIETLPINITHWWRQLSTKAEVPYYNIASGYAYFKFAALEHYRTKIANKSLKTQIAEYGELFY